MTWPMKGAFVSDSNMRQFDGLTGSPGTSQKEGQEDQRKVKELGGPSVVVLRSSFRPGLPSGSSLGSHRLSVFRSLLFSIAGQAIFQGGIFPTHRFLL